jgi:hypothetical protein
MSPLQSKASSISPVVRSFALTDLPHENLDTPTLVEAMAKMELDERYLLSFVYKCIFPLQFYI